MHEIVINTVPPALSGARRLPIVASAIHHLHSLTKRQVVKRFLLLEIGEPCTELRRAESERLLRAQPFLVEASVLTISDGNGGITVLVRTVDEYSIVVTGEINGASPYVQSVRLGSANIGGEGILAVADWRSGGAYRDGYGLRAVDNQFAGRPMILSTLARQDPLGSEWIVDALHPFYTDLQRIAWRARAGQNTGYVGFEPQPDVVHGVHLSRAYFDVGGMVRIGPPGRLSLFGGSFSQDRELPASEPWLITDSGLVTDTASVLRNRFVEHRIARVNVLWGVRDIGFVRARGLDALAATQDVPIGFQLGTQFGRSLVALGSQDDDIFMSADMYVGIGAPHDLFRLQFRGEARHDNDRGIWDGILISGRTAHSVQVSDDETIIGSLEWSGGWHERTPFALTLSDLQAGVRGYGFLRAPGGQRAVARLEDRHYLGTIPTLADVGFAVFADAGRLWSGDIPFGQTTPLSGSIGFSFMAALPPRSPRMWRLDLAIPQTQDAQHRIELRISNFDRTKFFWREPPDIEAARERTVPSSIFAWP